MNSRSVATLKFLRHGALAALLVAGTSFGAQADTPSAYLTLGGGGNFLKDNEIEGGNVKGEYAYHTGVIGLGAVGYRWGNGWRVELEPSYRWNSFDELRDCPGCGNDGDIDIWALMLNVVYDFDFGWPVKPYLGGGFGGARGAFDDVGPINGVSGDDNDGSMAYQGIAGLILPISETLEAFAEYRYFATQGLDLSVGTAVGKIKNEDEYRTHNAIVGVRWTFWQPEKPPPPPPPAPLAPPVKRFIIFFDWNRSVITQEADEILREAAAWAQSGAPAKVVLNGNADRSGASSYNVGLSRRRAENARRQLIDLGVPDNEISITWDGEGKNLVPTEDGVREPQNRNVQIEITLSKQPPSS